MEIVKKKRTFCDQAKLNLSNAQKGRVWNKEHVDKRVSKFKDTWAAKKIHYVSPLRTKMSDLEYGRELTYRSYHTVAKRKFGKLDLTREQVLALISGNCSYCGVEPVERLKFHSRKKDGHYFIKIVSNGIDRMDSSKPYTVENCVSCCKNCNYMKNALSVEEFKEHIRKVYNYLWK